MVQAVLSACTARGVEAVVGATVLVTRTAQVKVVEGSRKEGERIILSSSLLSLSLNRSSSHRRLAAFRVCLARGNL
jgi:hypothetical protein